MPERTMQNKAKSASNLAATMSRRGYISEIASVLGVTSAHISMVFSGKRTPSLDVAAGIARHVGCTIDDLYHALNRTQQAA